uniref:HRDC domain-containing protein n=1 Tax=Fagus sylvatica TaxID=28930 RepID=A0A2N9I554_FAGSY
MRVIAVTIGTLAALSIFLTVRYRRRRRSQNGPPSCCYLHGDQKPQHAFKRVLADNSYSPFKHLKLHDSQNENALNSHPYEAEISALLDNPGHEFNFINESTDLEMSEMYTWVETETQLKELVDILSKERVFAVDTEQHSLRSFLGFTPLIQISTHKEDFLVDTIALHDSMGVIRPVFADPSICKACEVLSKPQKSLAYLLETYCGVTTNKLLQREDWRQRPLSKEMVQYARIDAHYLLYIANCLITELKQQNNEITCPDDNIHFVLEASRRSNMTCLQLYTKEVEAFPGESAASSLSSRHLNSQGGVSSNFCETQFPDLVRRLCAWRDLMARVHDESLRYVLSDQAIVALADRAPITPTEICSTINQADLNVDLSFNSFLASPSPVVCSHLDDVYSLLQDKIDNLNDIFPMILQKSLESMQMMGDCFVTVITESLNGRYLRRDLAKLVDDSPPAIMLLFEPKGRPEDEDNDFYIQICVDCHEVAHAAAEKYKKQVAVEFGIPLFVRKVVDPKQAKVMPGSSESETNLEEGGVSPLQLRTAAMALLRHGPRMPSKRHEELTQIVISYYGGREISQVDLERALLVGMNPQERRRLEKKKGMSFKHSAGSILPNVVQENNKGNTETSAIVDTSEVSTLDDSHSTKAKAGSRKEDSETGADVGDYSICADSGIDGEVSSASKENVKPDRNGFSDIKAVRVINSDDNCESRSPSNRTLDVYYTEYDGTAQPKHNSKLSLLGHGPHGKQVVDHLLKEYGEDGIHQFCRRWRQVFVEAVHPCFLPAGWDVMHSGRRDFGEYSVYNPAKKATDPV